jgi:SAM-dependent methyltransferase
VLRGCPVATGYGLEFGALVTPLVRKEQGRVPYVDYTGTQTFRRKAAEDPNVDENVVVDLNLEAGALVDQCASLGPIDYAVASQVFEHLPNPVAWLRDVASLLVPGGLIALAVPDRRHTFDYFRAETAAVQLIAWDRERLSQPSLVQLADHYDHVRKVETERSWLETASLAESPRHHHDVRVSRILERAATGVYVDCHCSVWTSTHFAAVFPEVIRIRELPLEILHLDEPVAGANEFLVTFRRWRTG